MTTRTGTYFKGRLKLDKPLKLAKPARVTVVFENEKSSDLKLTDFSFLETQEYLKECKTSFADEVIEERRKAI